MILQGEDVLIDVMELTDFLLFSLEREQHFSK